MTVKAVTVREAFDLITENKTLRAALEHIASHHGSAEQCREIAQEALRAGFSQWRETTKGTVETGDPEPSGDPDYPEYANISAFMDDCFKAAGVTEVYDCDGYTAAELFVLTIRKQLEKGTPQECRHEMQRVYRAGQFVGWKCRFCPQFKRPEAEKETMEALARGTQELPPLPEKE